MTMMQTVFLVILHNGITDLESVRFLNFLLNRTGGTGVQLTN